MEFGRVSPLYAQLIGVGMLWVTIHCSGMCGPIIAGLVIHNHPQDQGAPLWKHRWSVAKHVLAYQGGRGIMYIILGFFAGLLGAQVEAAVKPVAAISSLIVAILLVLAGFSRLPDVIALRTTLRARQARDGSKRSVRKPPLSARFVAWITRQLPSTEKLSGVSRMFVTGFMLGLLPCGLMFWVLGLSASSASSLHGALLMLTLVAITTPVLVAAGLSTTLISPRLRQLGQHIIPGGMMFSGAWLGLIAMAANGWINHVHLPFTLAGKEYMFMLW